MSISYSGIIGHTEKVALPSIVGWGESNSIIRDPLKSITTRRIDKVGSTSCLTDEIDGSYDRICENIMWFARGVNPAVSVSYDNYGNGSRNGSMANINQASLPYKIMKDGAFQPPILRQEDLLPLSRLRRPNTEINSIKQFVDFSKRAIPECGTVNANKEIKNSMMQYVVNTMPTMMRKDVLGTSELSVIEPFIKDTLSTSANTNTSGYVKDVFDENGNPVRMKNVIVYDHDTNHSGLTKDEYIHSDLHLERNVPVYHDANTNTSRNIYVKAVEKEYLKAQKQNRPSYDLPGTTPIEKLDLSQMEKSKYIKPTISNKGGMSSVYTEYIPTRNDSRQYDQVKLKTQKSENLHKTNSASAELFLPNSSMMAFAQQVI